jgi:hypothetical protein
LLFTIIHDSIYKSTLKTKKFIQKSFLIEDSSIKG